jgi:hypothetical protein
MSYKETRKSHVCFAEKKTEARWLEICQTRLEELVSIHIKRFKLQTFEEELESRPKGSAKQNFSLRSP